MDITARLTGVVRTFKDVVAVRDLDLTLHGGRIYGLLGPNGSGKTTTLRTLLGLVLPDRGQVELLGGPPDDNRRARIGYVPEARALPEGYEVGDTLTFFARMRGRTLADARALSTQWIDKLELEAKASAKIKTLSNGQQQKVQIALALMCEPELIVLDEPLTALDPAHQDLVSRRFREAARAGATVLLSTHRLREAEEMIDHVVMLSSGVKVLDQPLREALREAFDGTWRITLDREDARADWITGADVASVERTGEHVVVRLQEGASSARLLARAAASGGAVLRIEAVMPRLHELYLARAGTAGRADAA